MTSYIQQLTEYIKKNLKKGYTIDSLRFSLINQGYTRISVEDAIELTNKQMSEEIPSLKEKPEITYKTEPAIPEKKGFFKKLFNWFFGD